jgi:U3 small nucleolar RNA-associated protein 12
VKVWSVDFSSQKEQLNIRCSHSLDYQNVLSILILPGNKYVVMGTKEGALLLYELATNELVHEVTSNSHKKEVWELAMHTNP